jgi:hypothetical protein
VIVRHRLLCNFPLTGNNILAESKEGGDDGGDGAEDDELDGYFESPEDDPPRWLLVLKAYLDESGQESKDLVVIAGFLGNEDAWTNLVSPWKAALGPQRKSLHMHDLRFKKKSEMLMLKRLAPLPVSCGLIPLHGGVRVRDYEDLLPDSNFFYKLHSGYISALFALVASVLFWLPNDERVELLFEQQDTYFWLANLILGFISGSHLPACRTKDGKPKIAKWGQVPKGSTPLTEPADFFSFSMLHRERDPDSLKSTWCLPLLESVESVKTIGHTRTKEQARVEVQVMLDLLSSNPELAAAFDRISRVIAETEINAKK